MPEPGPAVTLGEFLKARRALVTPPAGTPRRRVKGLRREEVAALAGVSADYYTRLEQGRHTSPSPSVLTALADALQLDEVARRHLFDLVAATTGGRPERPSVQRVRPSVHQLLASLHDHPAFVRGRRLDILAMNPLAGFVLHDFPSEPARRRNLIRWAFLDPQARERYREWEQVVSSMVGTLRLDAGRHPGDPLLAELVGELSVKSEEFRTWWAENRVAERRDGVKRLRHPLVGDLDVTYEALQIVGDEDQTLFIYSTPPGSVDEQKMRTLAGWMADPLNRRPPVHDPSRADPDRGRSSG